MSEISPVSIHQQLLTAVHSLCVTESSRLYAGEDYEFMFADLQSIPGAEHGIKILQINFYEEGKPLNDLSHIMYSEFIETLEIRSARVIAGDYGITVRRNINPMRYQEFIAENVAAILSSALEHDHEFCIEVLRQERLQYG